MFDDEDEPDGAAELVELFETLKEAPPTCAQCGAPTDEYYGCRHCG